MICFPKAGITLVIKDLSSSNDFQVVWLPPALSSPGASSKEEPVPGDELHLKEGVYTSFSTGQVKLPDIVVCCKSSNNI